MVPYFHQLSVNYPIKTIFLSLFADRCHLVDTKNVVHHIRHGHRWLLRSPKSWGPVFVKDSIACHASNRTTIDSMNQLQTIWMIHLVEMIVLLNEATMLAGAAVAVLKELMTTTIVKRQKTVRIPMRSTKIYHACTSNHQTVRSRSKLYCRHRAPVHTLARKRATP